MDNRAEKYLKEHDPVIWFGTEYYSKKGVEKLMTDFHAKEIERKLPSEKEIEDYAFAESQRTKYSVMSVKADSLEKGANWIINKLKDK